MSENVAELLNENADGWSKAMDLRMIYATADEVRAEWVVGPQHRQPYGIVHGGVHSGVVETVASVGAGLWAMSRGLSVVGLENHTSFLRAVREGVLHATARPVTRGKRTQVWSVDITSEKGELVAQGQVRLLCLDSASAVVR